MLNIDSSSALGTVRDTAPVGPVSPIGKPLPKWLDHSFFRRLPPESKQLIANKTALIGEITAEQVRSLEDRRFDSDPFFKTTDWIYVAFKAFGEGRIDSFLLSDLVIYDAGKEYPSFRRIEGKEALEKLDAVFTVKKADAGVLSEFFKEADTEEGRSALQEQIDKGELRYWKESKELMHNLPEADRHIYVYDHDWTFEKTGSEACFYGQLAQIPFVLPAIKDGEKLEVILLPPTIFQELLHEKMGEQALVPMPVLGFCHPDEEGLYDPAQRVMSLQHPQLTNTRDVVIHECSDFNPSLQAIYCHDMYHLVRGSAIPLPCREKLINLAREFESMILKGIPAWEELSKESREIALNWIRDDLLDLDFNVLKGEQLTTETVLPYIFNALAAGFYQGYAADLRRGLLREVQDYSKWADASRGEARQKVIEYIGS